MSPSISAARLAKTTRPRSGGVFRRERLFAQLDDNGGAVCTWIEGPPGSGKTSLISSFVSAGQLHCLWYQVDPDDADPSAFFTCMSAAARRTLGDTAAALPPLTPAALVGLLSYARLFFARLFTLAPTLTLVLDDYHEVALECPLHDILRIAIEQAPAQVRITVASRRRPPPQLARLKMNGAMRPIAWAQLELTADEVLGISALHGMPMDLGYAEHWRGRCGGWVAGLRLLLQASKLPNGHTATVPPQALLFDYLGEEVFRRLPKSEQSVLLQLACLPRIPVDVLGELAGLAAAEPLLARLARQNLFTTVSSEGPATYRFHPLFREFLMHRARLESSTDEVLQGCHRAADALQARGLTEDAVQVLVEGKAWQRLAQLVLGEAASCMAIGRSKMLEQWLCALPPAMLDHDPWLLYWLGASRTQLDPDAARISMERAFELFDARHDDRGVLLAWAGVVDCIFYRYFDLTELDPWIARLDRMQRVGLEFPSPDVAAKVSYSMFVALAFRQPQHPDFAIWRGRLQASAEAVPDPMFRLLARMHLLVSQIWAGDLHGAGAALQQLKREATNRPLTPFVELVGSLIDSTLTLYTGDVDACFAAVEKGLATAQASGIHIWDKVLLGQGAALALSHGQIERGRAYATRRMQAARAGDMEEQSLFHALEAWSCWLAAKHAEALGHARLGNDLSQRMGMPHFSGVNALTAAIVLFDCGDQAAGLRQVVAGREIGVLTRNPMLEWMADLLEAYMRLRRGEPATALITSCMTLGRQHGYRHFFFWPRHAVAVVCLEALSRGIEVGYVNELIDKGRLPAPESAQGEHWPWPVKVYTLGRFQVLVRGEPIHFTGKAQRVPLSLLKAIIARGARAVPEASVIDDLWPEADGDAGEQVLATTLSRLRKLIGAQAVKRQGGMLSIDSSTCWVDCLALQRMLAGKAAQTSRATCDKIKRLYHGAFLQGEGDAAWMLPLRERLHVELIGSLSRNAEAALANHQPELAAETYELGLGIDDLVEAFYAGLMRCHLQDGQTSLAVSTYLRCQRALWNQLGVAPSEATTRLYLSANAGKSGAPAGPASGEGSINA